MAPKPALGAHWFQITVTCVDRELWLGSKETTQNKQKTDRGSEGGGGGMIEIREILPTCSHFYTNVSKKAIRQGKLREITKCLLTRFS